MVIDGLDEPTEGMVLFRSDVEAYESGISTPGRITVTGRSIELAPPSLGRLVVAAGLEHRNEYVSMFCATMAPPWINTALLLTDGERVVSVRIPSWKREKLREALVAAGFNVVERRTLFSLGGHKTKGSLLPPVRSLIGPR